MDETKLREILVKLVYGELGQTSAIEAIKALLPPKIPVYELEEVAGAIEMDADGVLNIHLEEDKDG